MDDQSARSRERESAGAPTCPHCARPAELVAGADVYPHRLDLAEKKVWRCLPCDARVGCHDGTDIPLGTLAGPALRSARWRAHAAFDRLWKREHGGTMRRAEAYAWLAGQLGVEVEACHIGQFDEAWCERVVAACSSRTPTSP
jgi:hypothetical protein